MYRSPTTLRLPDLIERLKDDLTRRLRIRCPQCGWLPAATDRWTCASVGAPEHHAGCGTSWNTFATEGRCPGCEHQWRWTACLQCLGWAQHKDWYEEHLH